MADLNDALNASMQNIVDNEAEKKLKQGSFESESNSLSDIAALLRESNKAGLDVSSLLGATTKKRNITRRM